MALQDLYERNLFMDDTAFHDLPYGVCDLDASMHYNEVMELAQRWEQG